MKVMKSLKKRFKGLSTSKKVQVIMASLLTVFLLIAIPTFAWFSFSSRVETLTKIKAPTTLDIKAGHTYSVEYVDLSDIDVTDVDGEGNGHKDYIFAVKADDSSAYDIQLAHTTNIPFTYTLYRASELGDSTTLNAVPSGNVATFDYYDESTKQTIHYYYGYASKDASTETSVNAANEAKLDLTDLNPDSTSASNYGRTIAENYDGTDGIYSGKTDYKTSDTPEIYAVPLYSKHSGITTWDAEGDYFILRISWNTNNDNTAFAEWNAAANNKETDMIYISAKASASQ